MNTKTIDEDIDDIVKRITPLIPKFGSLLSFIARDTNTPNLPLTIREFAEYTAKKATPEKEITILRHISKYEAMLFDVGAEDKYDRHYTKPKAARPFTERQDRFMNTIRNITSYKEAMAELLY